MPKQNHLIGGKKNSKKNSSFRGKRYLGKEKSNNNTSESDGNTTDEMRKILGENEPVQQPMQMPQQPMMQQPMQPMMQQPMMQQPMQPMMQQPMQPMMQQPMMGMDTSMANTFAPLNNMGNLGNLSKLNGMAGLPELPQYSELQQYNSAPQQPAMPAMQDMGMPMNGLKNLSQLGRMF